MLKDHAGRTRAIQPFLIVKQDLVTGLPKAEVQKLNELLGLHPKMGPMAELFKAGELAIVQGVGYPKPDRSHFRSMEIWHTASVDSTPQSSGWLGRCLAATEPEK